MTYFRHALVTSACMVATTFSLHLQAEVSDPPIRLATKKWVSLLDKNLSLWDTYLSFSHKDSYSGKKPVNAKGEELIPVGYSKNEKNVFSVVEQKGEPVLKITGEIYGCVFTKKTYKNYHLKLQVKWGTLKHEPRLNKLKDSGILYHSIGEGGVDYWRAWMLSQEFQIMEGHIGDYWNIGSSAIDIRAYLPEGKMNSIGSANQPFLPFGASHPEGFCLRSENYESPADEWTSIELICFEGKSLHVVNGHVVMVLKDSRYMKDGKAIPLTEGKLQLQSEGSEVYYKNIRLKELQALPLQYAALFN
ncbi:3-keto-disaccharide hydrolase [Spirosoma flavum]|uniref:DUF1080 domain-containing protein n=1 Tax=Spirosoma flavum TaxID=2048557 RepID=A0ABW6AQC2_9BACT